MSASGSAAQRRRAFIERIERLEEERKTLADDIASVYDELKADGHDKAAVKIIVKIRRKEDGLAKWVGYSGTVDEYLADLGMLPKLEEARAGARVREKNIEEFPPHDPETGELTDTQEQPETNPATQSVPVSRVDGVPEKDAGRKTEPGRNAPLESASDEISSAHSPSPETPQATADEEAAPPAKSSATLSNPQPILLPGAGKAGDVPPPSSPAALSDAEIPAFLRKEEKKDCLKLKDGHCKISFDTPALCSVCNAERMKARAA